jgi:DNA-directed RNA polymerase specialized sigma24 family protein
MLDPGRLSLHLPRLTRIATRMTGSREAGEHLVQDTLERILRSPRRVAGDEFRRLQQLAHDAVGVLALELGPGTRPTLMD